MAAPPGRATPPREPVTLSDANRHEPDCWYELPGGLARTRRVGVKTRLVQDGILSPVTIISSLWPGAVPAIYPRGRAAGTVLTANHSSVETINPGGITPTLTFAANTTGGGIVLSVIDPAADQIWVWHARFDTVGITV